MAGQAQLYVKVMQGYQFLYDLDEDGDDDLLDSYVEPEIAVINVNATKTTETACSAVTTHVGAQLPTETDPEPKRIQPNQEEPSHPMPILLILS